MDITAEELERGVLVYSTEEALELFSALQRLDQAINRTDPWFSTDAEDAPKVAQIYDFREALKRMKRKIGARAS